MPRACGTYRGRRIFRAGPIMFVIIVVVTAIPLAGAIMTYRDRGWTSVSVGLTCAVVLGLGAIVENLVLRVELADDAMLVTELLGRRRYPIGEIADVREAKGVPTVLILADGQVVKLPGVGANLGNSIRAWLKGAKESEKG
jgi:hypothetical protein